MVKGLSLLRLPFHDAVTHGFHLRPLEQGGYEVEVDVEIHEDEAEDFAGLGYRSRRLTLRFFACEWVRLIARGNQGSDDLLLDCGVVTKAVISQIGPEHHPEGNVFVRLGFRRGSWLEIGLSGRESEIEVVEKAG